VDEAVSETNERFRLCRIGLALHTYADTWAHSNFSGRQHNENDVESIQIRKKGKWKKLFLENITLDLLPQIGHAEAGRYPDLPYKVWKYKEKKDGGKRKEIKRPNPEMFLQAASSIYACLAKAARLENNSQKRWDELKPQIAEMLSFDKEDVDERCDHWLDFIQREFPEINGKYRKLAWRNEALKPADDSEVEWDEYEKTVLQTLKFKLYPGFFESNWVLFHRAALKQRNFVLENLRWLET